MRGENTKNRKKQNVSWPEHEISKRRTTKLYEIVKLHGLVIRHVFDAQMEVVLMFKL